MQYDYKQLHYNDELAQEPWVVKGYKSDGYPEHSVLAGQTLIQFLDSYATEAEAVSAHPELLASDGEIFYGSAFMDQDLKSVDHIPDEPDYLF